MAVIVPAWLARNFTPTSTAFVSFSFGVAGTVALPQIEHGQEPAVAWVAKTKSAEVARLPAESLLLTR
jgi:hypothetical protein